MVQGSYKDSKSGISFSTWSTTPSDDPDSSAQVDFTWGLALPDGALKKDANEYIGYLVSRFESR